MGGVGPVKAGGEEDSYLASVSDLMVGMLFLFIIMLMGFALSYRSAEEQAEQEQAQLTEASAGLRTERAALAAERDALLVQRDALGQVAAELLQRDEARADLLAQVQQELAGRAVAVTVDPANGVLRLPESLLFDSGAATLRPEGEQALRALADVLMRVLPCITAAPEALARTCPPGAAPLLEALLIEGHTDEVPMRGGGFGDNWQLSTARGVNTFKALTAFRPELEHLRNDRGEALLGVSGYEARRPVATGAGDERRRLNRRIDLRFLVAAPGRDDLERLRARLGTVAAP